MNKPEAKPEATKRKKETKPRLKYQKKEQRWVVAKTGEPKNPAMPTWAVKSGGEVSFNRFVRAWVRAHGLVA